MYRYSVRASFLPSIRDMIKAMNDLPDSAGLQQQQPQNAQPPTPQSGTPAASPGVGGKEFEVPRVGAPEMPLRDAIGQEIELPKEVVQAGVQTRPTVVPLPQNVQRMGVQPAGVNVPVAPAATVVLPLTDDQIAAGLHEGVMSSFRWLSEWCIRKLKQVHIGLKTIHGKLMRVRT